LPEVDKIIMLDNGNIVEIGDYDDLKNSNGKFSSFIKSYIENQEKTNES
jgi:ABC-type multidrug transport system fused ATPase/permease subunit